MDEGNILKQMAEYDFNSPINVTMVFEDSDDDSDSYKSNVTEKCVHTNRSSDSFTDFQSVALRDCANEQNLKQKVNQEIESFRTIPKKNMDNNAPLNINVVKSRKRKTNEKTSVNGKSEIDKGKNKKNVKSRRDSNTDKTSTPVSKNTDNGSNDIPCPQIDDYEQVSNHVKNLLDTLSENIILIVESYYQMRKQLRTCNNTEIRSKAYKAFTFVRSSVLDLSYSSFVGLILPQEHNSNFIDNFLDRTVYIGNSKMVMLYYRCHIDPIFKDMLQWTKQKKAHLQSLYHRKANPVLTQHLLKPQMPPNFPAANSGQLSLQDTLVFSSGPPEREKSIALSSDSYNTKPNNILESPVFRAGRNIQTTYVNNNIELQYDQPSQGAFCRPNHLETNYLTHNTNFAPVLRPAPPPYNMHNPNYFQRPRELQSFNPVIQEQVDTTRCSESTESGYASPSFESPTVTTLDSGVVCGDQVAESQSTLSPIISNVVSLKPGFATSHGSCQMCGKATQLKSHESHDSEFHCSYICQQLDLQCQKAGHRKKQEG